MFVVFEGIDGSGKSTAVRFLAEKLKTEYKIHDFTTRLSIDEVKREIGKIMNDENSPHVVLTKEPTTFSGIDVKGLLPKFDDFQARVLLFAADRAVHTSLLKLVLEKCIVISDRYVQSSLAYQPVGDGLSRDEAINAIASVNSFAPHADVVFYLDVKPEVALERINQRKGVKETYESLDTLKKVKENYEIILKNKYFARKIVRINANKPLSEMLDTVWAEFSKLL